MPKTAYLINSTALSRSVIITDKAIAEQFAKEQTEHTTKLHTADPIEVHDNADDLNKRVDEATRESTLANMTPAQRRAFETVKPATNGGTPRNNSDEQS